MKKTNKISTLENVPSNVSQEMIQRLKQKPLSKNRFRYETSKLPKNIQIPNNISNKAALSLYYSIAESKNCYMDDESKLNEDYIKNSRSIKFYASEKYNKLRNKLLSDELKKDKASGKHLINTSLLALQEHIIDLKKKSQAVRDYQPSSIIGEEETVVEVVKPKKTDTTKHSNMLALVKEEENDHNSNDLLRLKETSSILKMSFIPTNIEALCTVAKEANILIESKTRDKKLSKLSHLPSKFGLCPASLNPDDTILSKIAKRTSKGLESVSNEYFAVINDNNMPLGGGSQGPNGVLHCCNSVKYGRNRINLFGRDVDTTLQLANDYIEFRDANLINIFRMYVSKLNSYVGNWKLHPTKDGTLPENIRDAYTSTCGFLSAIVNKLPTNATANDLNELGVSVVSFCQTWQKGNSIGEAQFSVMSPHFQTRFYVSDSNKLPEQSFKLIDDYGKMIDYFTNDMLAKGYEKAFVNIDKMLQNMMNKRTATKNETMMTQRLKSNV